MITLIEFANQEIAIGHDPALRRVLEPLFITTREAEAETAIDWQIAPVAGAKWELSSASGEATIATSEIDLIEKATRAVSTTLAQKVSDALLLRAAIVSFGDQSVLIVGNTKNGADDLCRYFAQRKKPTSTHNLLALPLAPGAYEILEPVSVLAAMSAGSPDTRPSHTSSDGGKQPTHRIGAILFPEKIAVETMTLSVVPPADAMMRLFARTTNAARTENGGLDALTALLDKVPALQVAFDAPEQLETRLVDALETSFETDLPPHVWKRIYQNTLSTPAIIKAASPESVAPPLPAINPATPANGTFPLTVGMATYDDFDGVYFSIQALRLNNPDLASKIEFIVIDNNPQGPCSQALKKLERLTPNYRYIPYVGETATAIRDVIFAEANGRFVMCMDCHVLLAPDALERLFTYLDENADTDDLLQGPLVWDDLASTATHFDPVWGQGMFGTWGNDVRGDDPNNPPFDIPSQGLGLFVARRDTWPGFNPKFSGFGGEEGYIHEKYRRRGDRTLCLPFLRWVHRFDRPMGVPYPIDWESRVRNYIIGFREVGLDEAPIHAHFSEVIGEKQCLAMIERIETELNNPFNAFDIIRWINLDSRTDRRQIMQRRFKALGIEKLVNRFPAIETPDNHHVGCTMSHRALLADAKRRGAENLLVFEDDAMFHRQTLPYMRKIITELDTIEWDILFIGGQPWGGIGDPVTSSGLLKGARTTTCCHAIAFNARIFDRLLGDIPADPETLLAWHEKHLAIDQYLAGLDAIKLIADPMLAMQIELFGFSPDVKREDFLD